MAKPEGQGRYSSSGMCLPMDVLKPLCDLLSKVVGSLIASLRLHAHRRVLAGYSLVDLRDGGSGKGAIWVGRLQHWWTVVVYGFGTRETVR